MSWDEALERSADAKSSSNEGFYLSHQVKINLESF
jgi:hypothetical protein